MTEVPWPYGQARIAHKNSSTDDTAFTSDTGYDDSSLSSSDAASASTPSGRSHALSGPFASTKKMTQQMLQWYMQHHAAAAKRRERKKAKRAHEQELRRQQEFTQRQQDQLQHGQQQQQQQQYQQLQDFAAWNAATPYGRFLDEAGMADGRLPLGGNSLSQATWAGNSPQDRLMQPQHPIGATIGRGSQLYNAGIPQNGIPQPWITPGLDGNALPAGDVIGHFVDPATGVTYLGTSDPMPLPKIFREAPVLQLGVPNPMLAALTGVDSIPRPVKQEHENDWALTAGNACMPAAVTALEVRKRAADNAAAEVFFTQRETLNGYNDTAWDGYIGTTNVLRAVVDTQTLRDNEEFNTTEAEWRSMPDIQATNFNLPDGTQWGGNMQPIVPVLAEDKVSGGPQRAVFDMPQLTDGAHAGFGGLHVAGGPLSDNWRAKMDAYSGAIPSTIARDGSHFTHMTGTMAAFAPASDHHATDFTLAAARGPALSPWGDAQNAPAASWIPATRDTFNVMDSQPHTEAAAARGAGLTPLWSGVASGIDPHTQESGGRRDDSSSAALMPIHAAARGIHGPASWLLPDQGSGAGGGGGGMWQLSTIASDTARAARDDAAFSHGAAGKQVGSLLTGWALGDNGGAGNSVGHVADGSRAAADAQSLGASAGRSQFASFAAALSGHDGRFNQSLAASAQDGNKWSVGEAHASHFQQAGVADRSMGGAGGIAATTGYNSQALPGGVQDGNKWSVGDAHASHFQQAGVADRSMGGAGGIAATTGYNAQALPGGVQDGNKWSVGDAHASHFQQAGVADRSMGGAGGIAATTGYNAQALPGGVQDGNKWSVGDAHSHFQQAGVADRSMGGAGGIAATTGYNSQALPGVIQDGNKWSVGDAHASHFQQAGVADRSMGGAGGIAATTGYNAQALPSGVQEGNKWSVGDAHASHFQQAGVADRSMGGAGGIAATTGYNAQALPGGVQDGNKWSVGDSNMAQEGTASRAVAFYAGGGAVAGGYAVSGVTHMAAPSFDGSLRSYDAETAYGAGGHRTHGTASTTFADSMMHSAAAHAVPAQDRISATRGDDVTRAQHAQLASVAAAGMEGAVDMRTTVTTEGARLQDAHEFGAGTAWRSGQAFAEAGANTVGGGVADGLTRIKHGDDVAAAVMPMSQRFGEGGFAAMLSQMGAWGAPPTSALGDRGGKAAWNDSQAASGPWGVSAPNMSFAISGASQDGLQSLSAAPGGGVVTMDGLAAAGGRWANQPMHGRAGAGTNYNVGAAALFGAGGDGTGLHAGFGALPVYAARDGSKARDEEAVAASGYGRASAFQYGSVPSENVSNQPVPAMFVDGRMGGDSLEHTRWQGAVNADMYSDTRQVGAVFSDADRGVDDDGSAEAKHQWHTSFIRNAHQAAHPSSYGEAAEFRNRYHVACDRRNHDTTNQESLRMFTHPHRQAVEQASALQNATAQYYASNPSIAVASLHVQDAYESDV